MMTPKPRRALRLPLVIERTGMRKTQIYDAVKRGIFPKPFDVLPGGNAVAWDEAEIDEHLERQIAARDTRKAAPLEPLTPIKQKRRS